MKIMKSVKIWVTKENKKLQPRTGILKEKIYKQMTTKDGQHKTRAMRLGGWKYSAPFISPFFKSSLQNLYDKPWFLIFNSYYNWRKEICS